MTKQNKPTEPRSLCDAEKDILIAKMLECPGQLSDSDVTRILEDDELRDIYNISVDLKAGKKSQIPLDATEEWKLFESLMDKSQSALKQEDNSNKTTETDHKKPFGWFNLSRTSIKRITRIAAVFVGAFLIVGAIQVMNHNSSESNDEELLAQNNQPITETIEDTKSELEDPTLSHNTTTNEGVNEINSEESQATTLQESSATPPTPLKDKKKKTKALVKSATQPQLAQVTEEVDIEEHLRIQRARMENDLAMQRAQAVINQYYTMAEMTGEDPNPMATNLNYTVTDIEDNELVALILP